ncbi:hypothetical protein PANT_7d00121 [Moesziomyces antarcticus T-34]|uniref:Zinc finger Mcm10/DnaG-type domain-containing protein n=1 Tax=Pseudozyma antarctica (strain T-34) TaxID=1151754 RepID=M9LLU7_PSEA3|nr:hypothetical protein PANT_7d00121 [Moesziomyces antarcticus T-34]
MEVTRVASTSRAATGSSGSHEPSPKRRKPDMLAPSSPSKSRDLLHQKFHGRTASSIATSIEEQERIQAQLLAFAETRARASSSHQSAHDSDADFRYPPGYEQNGSADARGLLEQIKNRTAQPKASNFLQKAKQVQQALLDKQRRSADLQKARDDASLRESLRSSGFSDEGASRVEQSRAPCNVAAFARGTQREPEASDAESDQDDADDYEHALSDTHVRRDDDLALIESLRPGPRAIPPNPDDPEWEAMEPFSGHRLRERKLAHSQLKEHLRARYHIPPSLLYSIARPISAHTGHGRQTDWKAARNGDFEVPVDGDWIVIATIVEKSDLLLTKGFDPNANAPRTPHGRRDELDDDPVLFKDAATGASGQLRLDLEPGNPNAFADPKAAAKPWQRKGSGNEVDEQLEGRREQLRLANRPRKFVVLKLVDLGVDRAQADGSGSAGRGDNYLSLVAYEADQVDTTNANGARSEVAEVLARTKWVNGSRGAFELLYQQAEGTVVAIMNPKVLRPFAVGAKGAKATKMLRISPRSAEDCLVIGQAADYRRCSAMRANGQRCASFVDTKARKQTRATVCDYHLSRHMDEIARGRPEFAANATTRFGGASSNAADGNTVGVTSTFAASGNSGYLQEMYARKLNSSFGNIGDGMSGNGGQVFVSESAGEASVRASDPASCKYAVAERYGRGVTEKQSRLKKQIEEQQLMRNIEARFAPRPAPRAPKQAEPKLRDEAVLPVLPNGSADMINAAYSTLDERKRTAALQRQAADAKRRKYTGTTTAVETEVHEPRLRFAQPTQSTGAFPIGPSRDRSQGGNSRSALLSLLNNRTPAAAEPSLKLNRAHRPKLRRPVAESNAKSDLTVVGGELVHLQDLDDWADDLDDLPAQSQPVPDADDDSDLEIV